MAVTQRDVARHLGIGQRTVSRAFGSSGALSDELRDRILGAARELGYQPNSGARALRTGRTGTALVVQGSEHPSTARLAPELYGALHDALERHDLMMGLARISDAGFAGGALPRAITEHRADGLLVSYETNTPPLLDELLARQERPVLWLHRRLEHDCVGHDDRGGARDLMAGLLARRRSLLYLDADRAHTPHRHVSRDERLDGARDACRIADRRLVELLPERFLDDAALQVEVAAALRTLPRPIGVLAYSSRDIAALVVAGLRLGLRIGEELEIAMLADEEPVFGVPVTWSLLDPQALAEAAAARLAARIAGDDSARDPILVPVRPIA